MILTIIICFLIVSELEGSMAEQPDELILKQEPLEPEPSTSAATLDAQLCEQQQQQQQQALEDQGDGGDGALQGMKIYYYYVSIFFFVFFSAHSAAFSRS